VRAVGRGLGLRPRRLVAFDQTEGVIGVAPALGQLALEFLGALMGLTQLGPELLGRAGGVAARLGEVILGLDPQLAFGVLALVGVAQVAVEALDLARHLVAAIARYLELARQRVGAALEAVDLPARLRKLVLKLLLGDLRALGASLGEDR